MLLSFSVWHHSEAGPADTFRGLQSSRTERGKKHQSDKGFSKSKKMHQSRHLLRGLGSFGNLSNWKPRVSLCLDVRPCFVQARGGAAAEAWGGDRNRLFLTFLILGKTCSYNKV